MKRSELNMLESYKRNELIDRLKPIKDWDSINKGELIWNDNSDSIFGYDNLGVHILSTSSAIFSS